MRWHEVHIWLLVVLYLILGDVVGGVLALHGMASHQAGGVGGVGVEDVVVVARTGRARVWNTYGSSGRVWWRCLVSLVVLWDGNGEGAESLNSLELGGRGDERGGGSLFHPVFVHQGLEVQPDVGRREPERTCVGHLKRRSMFSLELAVHKDSIFPIAGEEKYSRFTKYFDMSSADETRVS